jgi:hypothetical protein
MTLNSVPWTVAKAIHDGKPIVVRFREFPATFMRETYPHRLNLFWRLRTVSDDQLPDDDESTLLKLFEDRLVEAVEPDGFGVLSTVLTGRGQREYVIHVKNPDEFGGRLTAMPQERTRYPIEILSYEDAAWTYDADVTAPFR